jgi:hypothetical protein
MPKFVRIQNALHVDRLPQSQDPRTRQRQVRPSIPAVDVRLAIDARKVQIIHAGESTRIPRPRRPTNNPAFTPTQSRLPRYRTG